jgi:hypothetical protein
MRLSKTFAQTVFALAVVASTATSVSADWNWKGFWHGQHVGYHRNNAWPDPFNEVDAANVIAPFEVMKANGWRLHNTIGHELFREGDGALLASRPASQRWNRHWTRWLPTAHLPRLSSPRSSLLLLPELGRPRLTESGWIT